MQGSGLLKNARLSGKCAHAFWKKRALQPQSSLWRAFCALLYLLRFFSNSKKIFACPMSISKRAGIRFPLRRSLRLDFSQNPAIPQGYRRGSQQRRPADKQRRLPASSTPAGRNVQRIRRIFLAGISMFRSIHGLSSCQTLPSP